MTFAQRLALTTCLATLFLIGVGAFVRASGSGLGCPDWPTCHGGVVPPAGRHSLIEFSHRFTGSVVGLLVIATAVAAWRSYRDSPFVTWAAAAAVPLVGFQGLLGAITVLHELPPEVVATHLLTAMLVLTVELAVYLAMYLEDPRHAHRLQTIRSGPRNVGGLALAAIVWLAALMWVGGYMSASGASTACSGWPACNGSILPAADDQEVTHMVHRYLAAAFLFFVIPLVVTGWRTRSSSLVWARPFAVALASLYVLQVAVGAFNVWFTFPDTLAVAHTVIASCVWFTLAAAIILTFYQPASVRQLQPHSGAGVTA